ncbi:involucrin repeat protein [Histoplasma capsulatum var. duboisii H88]|uniref:Involucrin repeat protein n=1 Tax=Ajellomyces capsulatus (strain H88) TaxID=544711 RepID=F0UC69_AJEC8|nr:involucrin repeat protein [Histoplasma capsulatum var. duboisii H88]QSS49357.1 involucrin repeat protein [Histoplasma capsulatum var. duboisii H88]
MIGMNLMDGTNGASYRSSPSSYGDPKYVSSISVLGVVPPPSRVLVDGYRSGFDSIEDESPRYNPLNVAHPRSSVLLNANDPVVMHLLTETAMGDSIHFEVLSFEEAENLKKELSLLTNRINSSKRKLALEMKLQEAALSLSRLPDGKSRRDSGDSIGEMSPRSPRKRMNFFGRNSWGDHHRSDSELGISTRKCEELAQDLWKLERRAAELRRRLLEHTAGVLQMTHKGLKKKPAASNNFPRNQSSVHGSLGARENGVHSGPPHDFDDRSLYRTADHLDEYGRAYGPGGMPHLLNGETRSFDLTAIHNTERKLEEMNNRLRQMLLEANLDGDVGPVPTSLYNEQSLNPVAGVEAQLDYLERNLSSMANLRLQEPTEETNGIPQFVYHAEEKLEEMNMRLANILKASGSRSPLASFPTGPRRTLQEQLDYLEPNIDNIQQRVESLAEQKTILTTQIQQQRELNSKSDAERDAHFAELNEQISILKKELDMSRKEADDTRDELTLVMDQLDAARQESMIREQQRTEEEAVALSSMKEARTKAEEELSAKINMIAQLENKLQKSSDEQESRTREALAAKESSDKELQKLQSEYNELENEMIRVRTELTMAQAELDSAYGSRAERAAQVAANPAIQKEIDDLNQRNRSLTEEISILRAEQLNNSNDGDGKSGLQARVQMLEKELRDTIDDYEVMTKASIEFEKEREKLETFIDNLRDRCENLESKLCEERVQNMGSSSPSHASGFDRGASETTSIMVLKNEFKKMMRDTRAENMRLLKAEQEERRRLEILIRNLRKEQSIGKSNLSQSTISS